MRKTGSIATVLLLFGICTVADSKLTPIGVISLCFDDARTSVFSLAFPELARYQLPATLYVITAGSEENPGWHMSWNQIKILADSGWEIGSHSHTHPHLTETELKKIEEELWLSKTILRQKGFTVTSFAVPYGEYDETIVSVAKTYYESLRGTESVDRGSRLENSLASLNDLEVDPYRIASIELYYDYAFPQAKIIIDKAMLEKKWAVFFLHNITIDRPIPPDYQFYLDDLKKIAAYLAKLSANGEIRVMTISGFLKSRTGN